MQHARGREVKRLAVVSHATGDLRGDDDPWPGRERISVMSEALHSLAGGGEVPREAAQSVDGSLKRPSQPARELVRGARSVDTGEQRFDGAVVSGAEPGELVGGTAPWKAGRGTGPRVQRAISAGIATGRKVAHAGVVYRFHPDVLSNRKRVSRRIRASHRWM